MVFNYAINTPNPYSRRLPDPTLAQHQRLDDLYRDLLRQSEEEKRLNDEYNLVDNLAILLAMKASEELPARNGAGPKSRKVQRSAADSDAAPDSPGPSPSETRSDLLKRVKGTGQRSSSVGSARSGVTPRIEEPPEANRGLAAEKAGLLIIGVEVFYKFPKGSGDDLGAGIQCIIKKVWHEKKPCVNAFFSKFLLVANVSSIVYDVQDPEPDGSGKQNVHKATARDLIPIPQVGASLPVFTTGATVFARYPETDTFYKAKVRSFSKGKYTLKFEGEEEDNKEMEVDKRFVLDSKLR